MLISKVSKSILVFSFMAFLVTTALANTLEQKSVSAAVSGLYDKLQKDLAVSKVDLRLDQFSSRVVTRERIAVTGTATANEIPINFDVKINSRTNKPVTVEYKFVKAKSAAAEMAEADMQVVLSRLLMDKIGSDYKTKNITVAADNFEAVEVGSKTVYRGIGEVRIGDVDWSNITFEITLNDVDQKKSAIKYKVEN